MQRLFKSAGAIALTATLGACATITRGTTTEFTVTSTPPGAAVKTSTGFTCPSTPCSFKMPRKEAFVVTVTKDGFKPSETPVKSSLAANGTAGFLGNALVGGVIGAGVDISSGAMMDLNPNPLHIDLVAMPAPVAVADAAGPPAQAVVAAAAPPSSSPVAGASTAPAVGAAK